MTDNDDSYPLTDDNENLEEIVARFGKNSGVREQVSRARSPEGACGVFSRSGRLEPSMLFVDIAVLGILEPSLIRNAARQDIRLGGTVLFVRQPFSK